MDMMIKLKIIAVVYFLMSTSHLLLGKENIEAMKRKQTMLLEKIATEFNQENYWEKRLDSEVFGNEAKIDYFLMLNKGQYPTTETNIVRKTMMKISQMEVTHDIMKLATINKKLFYKKEFPLIKFVYQKNSRKEWIMSYNLLTLKNLYYSTWMVRYAKNNQWKLYLNTFEKYFFSLPVESSRFGWSLAGFISNITRLVRFSQPPELVFEYMSKTVSDALEIREKILLDLPASANKRVLDHAVYGVLFLKMLQVELQLAQYFNKKKKWPNKLIPNTRSDYDKKYNIQYHLLKDNNFLVSISMKLSDIDFIFNYKNCCSIIYKYNIVSKRDRTNFSKSIDKLILIDWGRTGKNIFK